MIQSELYRDIEKIAEMTISYVFIHKVTNLYVDWEVEQQFSEYKNNAMAFGTSNRNSNGEYMNFGKSGNVIKLCHLAMRIAC